MERVLLIATGNEHKIAEIIAILQDCGVAGWQYRTLGDLAGYAPPEEDGDSFAVNAAIKARSAAAASGLLTLADDSGLMVEALDGAPGIYSARYAGDHGDDKANRVRLLAEMATIPDHKRQAAFCCNVALAWPEGELWQGQGRAEGLIIREERGEGGFGYDSVFLVPEYGMTMAELPPEVKNRLSHRRKAMELAASKLRELG